jgi:hypothetical protein
MVSDPAQLRRMQTGEILHFALASVAKRGRPLAKLVTDYVEVSVRYHTGDGPSLVASEPDMNADFACPTTSAP